jgi:selenide,water dikinase
MVRASDVDVTLALDWVPLIDGARETVARGIFSSLQPQNVRLRRAIRELEAASRHPLYPLLFDPQTAGGLIASVPRSDAESCVAALRTAGYARAAIIGFVSGRSSALEPIILDLTGALLGERLSGSHLDALQRRSPGETRHAEESVH